LGLGVRGSGIVVLVWVRDFLERKQDGKHNHGVAVFYYQNNNWRLVMKKISLNAAMTTFIFFIIFCLSLIDAHAVNVALDWNTFMGSSSSSPDADIVNAIALDASGNLYVTGETGKDTWGNPINAHAGGTDGFVAKFDSSGNMLWNTFIGSNTDDGNGGMGIALDASGNVYVMGTSWATWGSPLNAFDGSYPNVFVAKLDSNGKRLWNTFLGSSGSDSGTGIAVDTAGNLYVTGNSAPWGNPINAHAGGVGDVFVAKLNSSGNLLWNTFMGANSQEIGGGIALDASGNVYVVGESNKTWGNPINVFAGGWDVFVAKLDSNGNRFWNTFMGSSDNDDGYFSKMSFDTSGNVYLTGSSGATWGSPIDPFMLPTEGLSNGFVAKLDSSGQRLWNTFIGRISRASGIKIDTSDNVYVTGTSGPFGNPINANAGETDAFVAKLNSSGNRLWHTFLGGAGIDGALDMALDASGNVYLGGYSTATWGSPINAFAGYYDGFAAKLNITEGDIITKTIDSSGGTLSSNDGCTISVPAGAVSDGTTFSITPVTSDIGQTITLSGGGAVNVVNHFYLDTSAANETFTTPVTIDLTWPENASIDLSKLVVTKDGVVVTTPCSINPCVPQTANCTGCNCNSGTRTFTVSVTGFSEFIIGEFSEATLIKLSSFYRLTEGK
jgi:hypothetical protein